MSERLENFIKSNRKQFDECEPPADLWNRIESELDRRAACEPKKEKVVKLKILYRVAACVLVFLSAGVLFFQYQSRQQVDVSEINPELAKEQVHYKSVIKERSAQLQQVKNQEPELFNEFSSELKKLDINYQKLKKDLETSPNREKTLKAMINNLKVQAQVLSQQLHIIDQVEQLKKEQHNEHQSI